MMRGRTFRAALRLGLALSALVLLGAACARTPGAPRDASGIVAWGVFDDSETMRPLISAFKESARVRAVEYKKVSPVDSYEQQLLRALAENRGPDVFLLHSSWIPRWKGALLPAPKDIIPVKRVQEEFVDTVADDLIADGRVLALPLSMDSLALYYNKDIFNAAGIARPPKTWQEVHEIVKRVTRFNDVEPNRIDRHGIAMGTGANVNRAPDILSILMMQNLGSGASAAEEVRPMADAQGVPTFGEDADALRAVQFYTDFANPAKDVYTWNRRSDYSLDAFAEGEAAMMIGYAYHGGTIRAKNPRLNVGVAPLPHVERDPAVPLTYAGYWVFAVSRQTTAPDTAWGFVEFLTRTDPSRQYLEKTGAPPARRDLVAELQNDPRIGVFARQSLTAANWTQADNRVVDRVFTEMADAIAAGEDTAAGSLKRAAEQIAVAAEALKRQGDGGNAPPR